LINAHQDIFADSLKQLVIAPGDELDISKLTALEELVLLDFSNEATAKRFNGTFRLGDSPVPNLKTLKAYIAGGDMPKLIKLLEVLTPNLLELHLVCISLETGDEFDFDLAFDPDYLFEGLHSAVPKLKHLFISYRQPDDASQFASYFKSLQSTVQQLKELQVLYIGSPRPEVDTVVSILESCPKIDSLVVTSLDPSKLLREVIQMSEENPVRPRLANVFINTSQPPVQASGFQNTFREPFYKSTGHSLLELCLRSGEPKSVIESLVRAGASLLRGKFHKPKYTALHRACKQLVDIDLFKFLLNQPTTGICLNSYAYGGSSPGEMEVKTCLIAACSDEVYSDAHVRLLLEAGASPIDPPDSLSSIAACCNAETMGTLRSSFINSNLSLKHQFGL